MSKTIKVAVVVGVVALAALGAFSWWSGHDDRAILIPATPPTPATGPARPVVDRSREVDSYEPVLGDRLSQADFDATVDQLDADDASVRTVAATHVLNWPGDAYDRTAAALAAPGTGPQAQAALRKALPRLKLRKEALAREVDAYEHDLKLALDAYAKAPAPDGGHDSARKVIAIGLKPSELRQPGETREAVLDAAYAARAAGCRDPLVTWLAAHAAWRLEDAETFAEDWDDVTQLTACRDLERSAYPEEIKALALTTTMRDQESPIGSGKGFIVVKREVSLLPAFAKALGQHLPAIVNASVDERITFRRVFDAYAARRDFMGAADAFVPFEAAYLKEGARPASDLGPRNLQGRYLTDFGWQARGGGFADTVTEEGWRLFRQRLEQAQRALMSAWSAAPDDARAARPMIVVAMAHGDSTGTPREWLDRALAADPDDRSACDLFLNNLLPRWSGSHAEMVAFGRECLAGGNWRADIPGIVVAAHAKIVEELADGDAYLAQPAVWADHRVYYDGYLAVFPAARHHLSAYAKAACDAGRWDEAKRLFDRIGNAPDLSAFEGRSNYDNDRRRAAAGGKDH